MSELHDRDGQRRFGRRRLLALLGLGIVAACDPAQRGAAPSASSPRTHRPTPTTTPVPEPSVSPTSSPTPEPTPTPRAEPAVLPTAAPYEPVEGDVYPEAKRAAARIVESLTTYDRGSAPAALVEAAGPGTGDFDLPAVIEAAAPLVSPDRQAVGVVLNGQLGGLDPTPETGHEPAQCSVLVVVDHHLAGDGAAPERVRRCIDVRLEVRDGTWRWAGLGDAGGTPVERPADLPEAAARVLDHPDIDLPDSARWDIHDGIIDDDLLEVMLRMAEHAPYRVTCLRAGHPETVFARPYASNHTLGRAVDVWSVDGEPVVLQSSRVVGADAADTTAHAMVAALLDETAVTELGSPWDLDGPPTADRPSTRSFTNTVHLDHLHVAFDN